MLSLYTLLLALMGNLRQEEERKGTLRNKCADCKDVSEEKKIGSMSKSELADLYGVSLKTFRFWIKEKKLDKKVLWKANFLPPKDVDLIIRELGNPFSLYDFINRG